jgi:uncharacterized protein
MAHVSIITLGVADLPRATRFYEELGWRRSSASQASITFFHGSTAALALFGRRDLAEDAGVPDEPAGFAGVTLAMNLPSPQDVDEALRRAARAGARITKPAHATDWGGYSGYFADLDGHLWEVAHNPHAPLAADGHVTLPDD